MRGAAETARLKVPPLPEERVATLLEGPEATVWDKHLTEILACARLCACV